MLFATLKREYLSNETLGVLTLYDTKGNIEFECKTLELVWDDNKPYVSCIPEGVYISEPRYKEKFKGHFKLLKVQGRTWILIHAGNFYTDIAGCILVGSDFKDINSDKVLDVINSKITLSKLYKKAVEGFYLHIYS